MCMAIDYAPLSLKFPGRKPVSKRLHQEYHLNMATESKIEICLRRMSKFIKQW